MPLAVKIRISHVTLILGSVCNVAGQFHGPPPTTGLHPIDIFRTMQLPALQDQPGGPLAAATSGLQVISRAHTLGLTASSATSAWRTAEETLKARNPPIAGYGRSIVFNGSTASALNALLADTNIATIRVTSGMLVIDRPIEISRRSLSIDLSSTQIMGVKALPYLIRIESAGSVTISGGRFESGDSGILVSNSTGVSVQGSQMSGLSGVGIAITNSSAVVVADNTLQALGLAGILIHRGTTGCVINRNRIIDGAGFSNMMAGIVLSDREVDITGNPRALLGSDEYGVVIQPITERLSPPHDNVITGNTISHGLSSGIYSDGGVRNVFFGNFIEGNSKEGLCLDNGSAANVVLSNTFYGNGNRWGDPDSVLALDFILAGGRLPNGTAAEKVPGLSLDNAIYNIVFDNDIAHNFGGGIKIVRTGYFNAIGHNTIFDNNDGAGQRFHFFGIELGAAAGSSVDLDFTPSRGNVVFSNVIRGSHYSGIYLDFGSDTNSLLYNVILDASGWAIEAVQHMSNLSVNNLTNLPSRNIGSGLDPALVTSGQAVNDAPD